MEKGNKSVTRRYIVYKEPTLNTNAQVEMKRLKTIQSVTTTRERRRGAIFLTSGLQNNDYYQGQLRMFHHDKQVIDKI